MTRRPPTLTGAGAGVFIGLLFASSAISGPSASFQPAATMLAMGETAHFAVTSSTRESSDFKARCELTGSGGLVSVTFDAEHYIPLSEPAVGDVITLQAGEVRRYDMVGTFQANSGDAFFAFTFSTTPQAFCFPGMDCGAAAVGGKSVRVSCNGG